MASSFIQYGDRGFWIYDSAMETVVYFINIVMHNEQYANIRWLNSTRKRFGRIERGEMCSFISLGLDEILTKPDRVQVFLKILNDTRELVLTKGEEISFEELKEIQKPRDIESVRIWNNPIKVNVLNMIISNLISLINGEPGHEEPKIINQ